MRSNAFLLLVGLVAAGTLACGQSSTYGRPAPSPVSTGSRSPESRIPTRLAIPSIGVNATIEAVGIGSDGAMEAPANADDAGWYSPGPQPGNAGDAVIDGHLDRNDLSPAVFWHLDQVRPGNAVTVEASGSAFGFTIVAGECPAPGTRVPAGCSWPADATTLPPGLFGTTGAARLSLITCGGDLVGKPGNMHYASRLIVTAAPA